MWSQHQRKAPRSLVIVCVTVLPSSSSALGISSCNTLPKPLPPPDYRPITRFASPTDWVEPLAEEQTGFRKNRGIDDTNSPGGSWRKSMWPPRVAAYLVRHCPCIHASLPSCALETRRSIGASRPLHQGSQGVARTYHLDSFRSQWLYSSEWLTDRGLREGCPSSPVLFNIFHKFCDVFQSSALAHSEASSGLLRPASSQDL